MHIDFGNTFLLTDYGNVFLGAFLGKSAPATTLPEKKLLSPKYSLTQETIQEI